MIITLSVTTEKVSTKSQAMATTLFDVREIDTSARSLLEEIFTTHNYSTNIWRTGKCLNRNFMNMTGVILDVDKDLTIQAARDLFKDVNYIIHTSTSHMVDIAKKGGIQERFRIILPFEKSDYTTITSEDILVNVYESLLTRYPFIDASCKDPARKYFPFLNHKHPSLFELYINDIDKWFKLHLTDVIARPKNVDVSSIDESSPLLSQQERNGILHLDDIVVDSKGNNLRVSDIKTKTAIKCLFHDDATASAFIDVYPSRRKMLICTATGCGAKAIVPAMDVYPELFYLGDQLYKVYEQGSELAVDKVNQKYLLKLHQEERDNMLFDLTNQRNVAKSSFHIQREVNGYSEKTFWELLPKKGLLRITYPPITVNKKDNDFIDQWLLSMFGEHTAFIKQWLALYCYMNHIKLPTLVLPGQRSIGKSTFAEFVGALYEHLGWMWSGEKEQFTPELQKHLLIADEAQVDKKEQYLMIKQLSGSAKVTVNEKHLPQFQTINNLCFILLTNNANPLFLVERERPTDEKVNQFFMWEIYPPKIRNAFIKYELQDRAGHYVRTELRSIYEQWLKNEKRSEYRYSILTPITPLLIQQYNSSKTQAEYDSEDVWNICLDGMDVRDRTGILIEKLGPYEIVTVPEIGKILKVLGKTAHNYAKTIKERMQTMGLIARDPHHIKKNRSDAWKVIPPATENKEATANAV